MLTADMAFRINAYGDYGVANALGFISYLMTGVVAWIYLRQGVREHAAVSSSCDCALRRLSWARCSACSRSRSSARSLNLVLWAFAEQWYFPYQLPLEYGFSFWQRVFRPQGHAMESLGTSIAIALFTVAACLAVSIPAGYALARRALPLRALILLAFLLPQAFPSLAVYINIARIFYSFGLNGTIAGVVLVHTMHGLVFAVWIATAAFAAVDRELEDAARSIGAAPLHAFVTVTLPLAAPGIMASAIFVFLESLDEFTGTFFVGVPGGHHAALAAVHRLAWRATTRSPRSPR